MNGMHIPRTPIVVDYWRLRKVPPRALFFLTHFHADHTSGLSAQWPYPIHCTHITACLLREKFRIKSELIVELEVGESRILHVDTPKERVSISVSVLDANHCPGSAMFIFAGYFGRIMYTGDFRYSPEMDSLPELTQSSAIDMLFLDNTYCHKSCQFPSREQATDMVVSVIREHTAHTILIGLHSLGKEELLVAIAKRLGVWVGVSPERYKILQLLKAENVFTTDMDSCFVKVLPFHLLLNTLQMESADPGVLGVLPTCIFTGTSGPTPPSHQSIKVVPYSDHSSYDELLQFVRLVRPRSVRSIVRGMTSRSNMGVFDHLLDHTPVTDFEIPEGISQLLSVQSNGHPPPPACARRHTPSPTVTTINNRGRKRAVGVCYLSPPKKRNGQDENGVVIGYRPPSDSSLPLQIKHILLEHKPARVRERQVLSPVIRALARSTTSIQSDVFYGTEPCPAKVQVTIPSSQSKGKGRETPSHGKKPRPPTPSLKSWARGKRRVSGLGVKRLKRGKAPQVTQGVDVTIDIFLGITEPSTTTELSTTTSLPSTFLETIDNLLRL